MEHRRFSRISFPGPARLNTQGQHYDTELLDISLNGALVRCPAAWPQDSTSVTLHLPLAETEAEIVMTASVVHQNEQQLGLHCEAIDLESISHLKRLVQLNLGNEHLLERELSELTSAD
ncbi:MAG: PilZ domain-containing protein [Alkalimonas sp.]|nr:PilZ domain-containing protein [Alkalimonas sp.]